MPKETTNQQHDPSKPYVLVIKYVDGHTSLYNARGTVIPAGGVGIVSIEVRQAKEDENYVCRRPGEILIDA